MQIATGEREEEFEAAPEKVEAASLGRRRQLARRLWVCSMADLAKMVEAAQLTDTSVEKRIAEGELA